ncbi:MAG TPA: glycosyltransferase family 39 protein [Acetobacteraceae bacterium]|nr:glycosyltransferase family 39 protein [Acetobacteraceae bacterium]
MSPDPRAPAPAGFAGRQARRLGPILLPASSLLLLLLARLPVFPRSSLDWDESLYAVMAEAWRHGHPPYTTIWDNKPPGIYAIFALAESAAGDPVLAIRLAALLAAGCGAWIAHGLVRDLGGDDGAAWIGSFAYIIASATSDGLSSNTELFMVVFTAASMRAALHGRAGLAGPLFGAAILIKYVAIFEAPALVFALILASRDERPGVLRRRVALAIGGTAAMGALTLAWFAGQGSVTPFLVDTVLANFRRATLGAAPGALATALTLQLIRWGPLYLAAAVGIVRRKPGSPLLRLWLPCAFIGAISARLFYDHYFLQMLPPLCVGAALSLPPSRLRPALAALILILPAIAAGRAVADGMGPILHCGPGGCVLHPDTPRLIAARVPRGASLYVFDSEPILYALTASTPPTPYVLPSVLTRGRLAPVAGVNAGKEVARILAGRPEFIVVRTRTGDPEARVPPGGDPAVYAELDTALAAAYHLEAAFPDALLYRRR